MVATVHDASAAPLYGIIDSADGSVARVRGAQLRAVTPAWADRLLLVRAALFRSGPRLERRLWTPHPAKTIRNPFSTRGFRGPRPILPA